MQNQPRKRPASRSVRVAAALGISLLAPAPCVQGTPAHPIEASGVVGWVRVLASDEMEGRATGSAGGQRAAAYIAREMQSLGLKPLPGLNGYMQDFTATVATRLGPGNTLRVPSRHAAAHDLEIKNDYVPFDFSGSDTVTAPVVFAGYGITAPEYTYDDYDGLDVKGKIVLVLRHEPRENDSTSVFDGRRDTYHAEFRTKAKNAADHGAAGILVVTDPLNHEAEEDKLTRFGSGAGSQGAVPIPAVHITRKALESFWGLGEPGGFRSLKSVQQEIDQTMKPMSFEITPKPVTLATDVEPELKPTANVLGYLPPTGWQRPSQERPDRDEYVVVGAHYDHLGMGGRSSLAPDTVAVHHGADDNASGVAAVVGVAQAMASDPAPRQRGVLFAAFSGEELGVLGSGWFVNHPPLPLDGAVAMINMDMVGRMRNDRLEVGGVGSSPRLKPLLEKVMSELGIKPVYSESGVGPSDHTTFYQKKVPVLFFFTGVHEDYHKPSDTWDRINGEGLKKVADLALEITEVLTQDATPVPFVQVQGDSARAGQMGRGGGYGAYLGTIPDFGESVTGVKISGVKAGSPAETAGLKGGDIIVAFDGKTVANLYDLTDELRSHRPGDAIQLSVVRGGEKLTLKATLGKRGE